MNFQFDKNATEVIMAEAKRAATDAIISSIMASFNAKQIVAEIKNEAINAASRHIFDEVMESCQVSGAIQKALRSVEVRMTSHIQKSLSDGITVKFKD